MVGHGGSSAGSYLADPTSPIPSHRASIVVTSTLRVNKSTRRECQYTEWPASRAVSVLPHTGSCTVHSLPLFPVPLFIIHSLFYNPTKIIPQCWGTIKNGTGLHWVCLGFWACIEIVLRIIWYLFCIWSIVNGRIRYRLKEMCSFMAMSRFCTILKTSQAPKNILQHHISSTYKLL